MIKCKYCKNLVENGSIFCRFCGSKLIKTSKKEISVPKPVQLKSGKWRGQLMVNGKRIVIHGDSMEDYEMRARAAKVKLIEVPSSKKLSLRSCISSYIRSNSDILSPSTLRAYEFYRDCHFSSCMDCEISSIDFQSAINDEAKLFSAKTVRNVWSLVSSSLKAADLPVPKINLPKAVKHELPWLDFTQIGVLLAEAENHSGNIELAIILGLHSLRLSEILALERDDIFDDAIHVRRAAVKNKGNEIVLKDTTKTDASLRTIPILIPRLLELLPESGKLVPISGNNIRCGINRVCKSAGLPEVGVHGLRRSFASLCYHLGWSERSIMLIGGWSNLVTVHNFYIKLAQNDVIESVERMKNYYEFTTKDSKALEIKDS